MSEASDSGDDSSDELVDDPATQDDAEAAAAAEVDDVGEIRDELPDDLNASEFVGPYVFPNNNRRRIPGVLYLAIGAAFVLLYLLVDDSPLVNQGWAWGGGALMVIGAYNLVAGWSLKVDENDALVEATRTVGFPVGHASAQLGWRGWLSRPTWRILLYSNEPQPDRRGLVLIDGYDGEVLDTIIEKNPEDWSQYV